MAALGTWGHAGVMSGGEVWPEPEHAILVDPPLVAACVPVMPASSTNVKEGTCEVQPPFQLIRPSSALFPWAKRKAD
jgi:hypothetical protein